MDEVAWLLEVQSGVITRRQLERQGVAPASVERMLRRRELVRITGHPFSTTPGSPAGCSGRGSAYCITNPRRSPG
jgi:hypothetical protein